MIMISGFLDIVLSFISSGSYLLSLLIKKIFRRDNIWFIKILNHVFKWYKAHGFG